MVFRRDSEFRSESGRRDGRADIVDQGQEFHRDPDVEAAAGSAVDSPIHANWCARSADVPVNRRTTPAVSHNDTGMLRKSHENFSNVRKCNLSFHCRLVEPASTTYTAVEKKRGALSTKGG